MPLYKQKQIKIANDNKANTIITDHKDTFKQKLSVFSHRLARYLKNKKRKEQNKQFLKSEKGFYRNIENPKANHHQKKLSKNSGLEYGQHHISTIIMQIGLKIKNRNTETQKWEKWSFPKEM